MTPLLSVIPDSYSTRTLIIRWQEIAAHNAVSLEAARREARELSLSYSQASAAAGEREVKAARTAKKVEESRNTLCPLPSLTLCSILPPFFVTRLSISPTNFPVTTVRPLRL